MNESIKPEDVNMSPVRLRITRIFIDYAQQLCSQALVAAFTVCLDFEELGFKVSASPLFSTTL